MDHKLRKIVNALVLTPISHITQKPLPFLHSTKIEQITKTMVIFKTGAIFLCCISCDPIPPQTSVQRLAHTRNVTTCCCVIQVWKLKSQEYKKDDLHPTFTLTVRLTGTPTPLSAVHRYVPFVLLWILLSTYFPSTTGSRGALSVPSSSTFVQLIVGVGLPVALQLKVTKESSQIT